ncbi:MAG: hypothetical protein EXS18_01480 [Verrucomicrobiae bacterium]|nr:hypothetical protein [Verrucomicrobiae bacterium]
MSDTDKLILGLWDGHESGAALVSGSQVVFAINEERLTRRKLEIGFPARSIQACLQFAGCKPDDISDVAISTWDPAKTLTRCVPSLAEQYYQIRRKKVDMTASQRRRKLLKYKITELPPNEIARSFSNRAVSRHLRELAFSRPAPHWYDHHYCHATAAAFCSGFDKALVITIDGIGDGLSGSISAFEDGKLRRISAISGKTSLGIFFEHVTNLLNMRELEDEGKVMALANFAFPVADSANPLLDYFEVDGLTLRAKYGSVRMYRELQRVLWRYPSEQFAAMAQRVLEIKVVQLMQNAMQQTGLHRIAYSGGVASNIKVNMLVHDLPGVERLFVFPHMGDGGLALGAAMAANHELHGVARYSLPNLFLGPSFEDGDILAAAQKAGLVCRKSDDVVKETAQLIHGGEIVLWFQGRMELGPRSLGARSILARPDSEEMKNELNLKLKKRVYYQPFCPAMLHLDAAEILENYKGVPNPFMTVGYRVRPEYRAAVRGVINIDGSCRPQILHEENSRIARLLREYRKLAGRGILLNTSFNTHGEPIVCAPADAVRTFVETDVNYLIMEDFIVTKTKRA